MEYLLVFVGRGVLGKLVDRGGLGMAVSFGELPDRGDFVVDDCVLIERLRQDSVVFAE